MDASARQIIRVGPATADRSPGGGRVLMGISATAVAEQRDCLDFAVADVLDRSPCPVIVTPPGRRSRGHLSATAGTDVVAVAGPR
jgi:hypothetical protein